MGVVYRATQISLKRPVALKMILAGHLASAPDVERFQREAEAAARLDHPQIVPIYEVGEHEGTHYFSMKLVEGGDLTQHLPRLVKDHRAVADLVATLADAIHHAHQRGILHRDLKPRNILLDADGEPQITDFGLAKQVDASGELTQSGAIVGTASYMAPEQARGEKTITTAVDVYGLGAILYELLTGRPPFRGATPAETIVNVLEDEPVRPSAIRSEVDRDLETICLKCLEKDPGRRYGSAAALAEDLRRWLAGLPITARPVGNAERLWRWCRRNPVLAISSGLILALIAVFSWSLWDENQADSRRPGARESGLEASAGGPRRGPGSSRPQPVRTGSSLAMSAPPESRWEILDLLNQAGKLPSRQDAALPAPPDDQPRLPRLTGTAERSRRRAVAPRPAARLANGHAGGPAGLCGDGRRVLFREGSSLALMDWVQLEPRGRWSTPAILGTALAVDTSGRWLASWNSADRGSEHLGLGCRSQDPNASVASAGRRGEEEPARPGSTGEFRVDLEPGRQVLGCHRPPRRSRRPPDAGALERRCGRPAAVADQRPAGHRSRRRSLHGRWQPARVSNRRADGHILADRNGRSPSRRAAGLAGRGRIGLGLRRPPALCAPAPATRITQARSSHGTWQAIRKLAGAHGIQPERCGRGDRPGRSPRRAGHPRWSPVRR